MGRTHAEAIRRAPGAELVAVSLGRRAQTLAQDYGAIWEEDAAALVNRPDVDVVVIATPHHLHADQALAAMRAGRHVMIEKPLATTLADCDRIAEVAAETDRLVRVGYHQRFRANNRAAATWIRAGKLGQLVTAQVSMPTFARNLQAGGFGGDWSWWNQRESLGHVFNSAPHAIDLLRWFTGDDVETVSAFCRSYLPGVAVEDTTLALMAFAGGGIASLFSSRALPAPSWPGEDFRLRLMGDVGVMDLDPTGELRVTEGSPGSWRSLASQPALGYEGANTAFGDVRMQAYRDQILAMVDALEGRDAEIGSWADGRAGVAACVAMMESSRCRRWMDLGAIG